MKPRAVRDAVYHFCCFGDEVDEITIHTKGGNNFRIGHKLLDEGFKLNLPDEDALADLNEVFHYSITKDDEGFSRDYYIDLEEIEYIEAVRYSRGK